MILETAKITNKLSRGFTELQSTLLAETLVELYNDVVKIKDFSELKETVQRMSETLDRVALAQERTEQSISELSAAQERTEQSISELTEAQAQSEQRIGRLETSIDRLTQAQAQSEQRIGRLETSIDRLTQAQEKTELLMQTLIQDQHAIRDDQKAMREDQDAIRDDQKAMRREQRAMRKELGGLSTTVGYTLENVAYVYLPRVLEEKYGIVVQGELLRTFVTDNRGNDLEVNIYGEALQDGKPVTIIGESKSQLSANKVDEFFRDRVERFSEVFPAIVPVLVTHMISSKDVDEYTRSRGCLLVYSYQLQDRPGVRS